MNDDEPAFLETIDQPRPAGVLPAPTVTVIPSGESSETQTQAPGTHPPAARVSSPRLASAPPGYVITRELGRGGMGVVWLAEQTSLKRLVALKMIRGGGGASFEELARFRVEAEAVARLQHPNIVQIFEVGEHDGNPFFALEYVAGGSMAADLTARAWTPSESAGIVETLARAMHHAHQKNLVHRDLKPANVLLTSDRDPKITDFGLAKRLEEGDSGHTRTGAVMGTPSYMSPEQASGRIRQIGPATDVYALGAILYECLTGRTPFRGESVLDTLEMVRSADPEPPSKVRHGVPADLETICLKAMAKEPEARYASALALAQDLERFRGGEPILGRREGILRKWLRKARRQRTAVAAGLAVVVALATIPVGLLASRSSRTLLALEEHIAQDLEEKSWDTAEADIERLAKLDPARGQAARQKLIDRFSDSLWTDLRTPRLCPHDVSALETKADWLTARKAGQAAELRSALQARLRAWQPLADVMAPFDTVADVFPPGRARIDVDRLYANKPLVVTKLADQGTLRAEIDFQGDWTKSNELGLLFGHRPDGPPDRTNGYAFLLRAAWPEGDPETPAKAGVPHSFEASNRISTLEILRDGVRQSLTPVRVRHGSVRLTAVRNGGHLSIRLNGLTVNSFEDPFPLPCDNGATLAILWPRDVSVRRLTVEDQTLPPEESPLQHADALYSQGRTAEALGLYEAYSMESPDSEGGPEARHKAGLCLARLKRGPEALAVFDELAAGTSRRWGVNAAFEAWRLRLDAGNLAETDTTPDMIKSRFPEEMVTRCVPAAIRQDIADRLGTPSVNGMSFDPSQLPQLEAAVRRAGVLQLKNRMAEREILSLVLARGLAGNFRKAKEVADEHLEALLELGHSRGGVDSPHRTARLRAWMGRLAGDPDDNDALMRRHLGLPLQTGEDADMRGRAFVPLRLETARRLAIAGDWPAAEKELDACLAEYPLPVSHYSLHAEPRLMKGFARLNAGDSAGAVAVWKAGTYASYLEENPSTDLLPANPKSLVEAWALAALSDTLTDDDATRMLRSLTKFLAPDDTAAQIAEALAVSPAVMRGAWTSPRGKEWARRLAFLDLTPVEYFQITPRLLVYETIRRDLFAGTPTPEEDDIVWLAARQTGEMSKTRLLQLAHVWKGAGAAAEQDGLLAGLKPGQRGPVSHVLGWRYRRLNQPAQAEALFKVAVADSVAGSSLGKLAEAELKKGK